MPRQQSDATKLRHAKREMKELRAKVAGIGYELLKRRLAGAQMANVCFNLGQVNGAIRKFGPVCERAADTMWQLRQEWDEIQRVKGI